jgi:hypothetical protein
MLPAHPQVGSRVSKRMPLSKLSEAYNFQHGYTLNTTSSLIPHHMPSAPIFENINGCILDWDCRWRVLEPRKWSHSRLGL